jgi:hypothetical protein
MGRIDELIEAVADEIAADTSALLDDSVCERPRPPASPARRRSHPTGSAAPATSSAASRP